jgi:two-component system response regulator AtoC
MTFEKILIVSNEPELWQNLEQQLRKERYWISHAGNLGEAHRLLECEDFDALLLEFNLQDGNGLDFLERIVIDSDAPVVITVGDATNADAALRSIRLGAFDFLSQPLVISDVLEVIHRAELSRHAANLNRYRQRDFQKQNIICGKSPQMVNLSANILRIASSDTSVLIEGESGVGKVQIAEAVHESSKRASSPFIKLNCAANPAAVENELFADHGSRSESLFELADSGTLLLQEIGELPLTAQARLLGILRDREFERRGRVNRLKVNARIMATTQTDLSSLVAQGEFLQELLAHFTATPLRIPSLRERASDIPQLIERYFDNAYCRHYLRPPELSQEALRHLMAHSWPGNIRELENALERAVILTGTHRVIGAEAFTFLQVRTLPLANTATVQHFSQGSQRPSSLGDILLTAEHRAGAEPLLTLEELEKRHILKALEHTNQNRTRAAGLLKISVRTLRNKLHQYQAEAASAVLALSPTSQQSQLPMLSPVAGQKRTTADLLPVNITSENSMREH